jgi:hypothetical protein
VRRDEVQHPRELRHRVDLLRRALVLHLRYRTAGTRSRAAGTRRTGTRWSKHTACEQPSEQPGPAQQTGTQDQGCVCTSAALAGAAAPAASTLNCGGRGPAHIVHEAAAIAFCIREGSNAEVSLMSGFGLFWGRHTRKQPSRIPRAEPA